MKKISAILALLVLLVACTFNGCSGKESIEATTQSQDITTTENTATPLNIETVFTHFETKDLQGKAYDQSLFSNAELTMVVLWVTYVPEGLGFLKDFSELQNEIDNFQVVGFTCGLLQNGDGTYDVTAMSDAQKVIEDKGADFVNLLPYEELVSLKLSGEYSVPEIIFVDKDGNRVGENFIGTKDKAEWQGIIEGLLKAK